MFENTAHGRFQPVTAHIGNRRTWVPGDKGMSGRQANLSQSTRLDSWKEIAAFFGRDERTVKRWEKSRSLPIHRIPGNQRGGVFAYPDELTDWLNSTPLEKDGSAASPENAAAAVSQPPEPAFLSEQESAPSITRPLPSPAAPPLRHRSLAILAVSLVLLLSMIGLAAHQFPAARAVPLPSSSPAHVASVPDKRAVELYLMGRYYWNRRTGESLNRAVDAFTQAIVIDPSYAEAYAGLADTYDLLREYTAMPESEAYPRAIAAATKAVALNNSLAEAHRALAFSLFYWKWEVPEALEEFREAIRLDPNNADAHHWYATSLLSLGRPNEALAEIERARALSPTSPSILVDRALILYHSGEREAGLTALKEMEQAEPEFLSPPRYLAELYFDRGDYANYLKEAQRAALLSGNPREAALVRAAREAWQAGGDRKMLEAMAAIQLGAFEEGNASGFQLAETYLQLGRKKNAIHYFEAAFAAHDANLFFLRDGPIAIQLKGDPDFDLLREKVLLYTDRKLGQPLPA
jgi:tetratricopeptide (TPR) repeat protein